MGEKLYVLFMRVNSKGEHVIKTNPYADYNKMKCYKKIICNFPVALGKKKLNISSFNDFPLNEIILCKYVLSF